MILVRVIALILLVTGLAVAQPTTPQPSNPAPTPQATPAPPKKESALAWLLRIAGITATSNKQKGNETDTAGVIWVADLVSGESIPLRQEATFRWPIFLTGNRGILALRNNDVVWLSLTGKDERVVATGPNIAKLVASSVDNPDQVLVVTKTGTSAKLGTLSLSSGLVSTPEFETKPINQELTEEQLAVDVAMGSEREYGILKVYVETIDAATPRSRTEVMLIIDKSAPNDPATNLSSCIDSNCSQPSISIEGRYVAYIKSPRR